MRVKVKIIGYSHIYFFPIRNVIEFQNTLKNQHSE